MIKIGRIVVSLEMREARLDGRLLEVGSRAFDILELLIRANGKTVTKDEILRHVWPKSVVGENNIHVQLSTLRRVLGADGQAIHTVSGRGYRLANAVDVSAPADSMDPKATHLDALPHHRAALIGRESALAEIVGALQEAHLVTLLGSGGIGKTQLGIAAARSIAANAKIDVCFVSLAAVNDARMVADTIAEALGIERSMSDGSIKALITVLQSRKILLLLDNCEHVIEAAASLAQQLVEACAELRILATSREPLRTHDEKCYRVAPLDMPDVEATSQAILASASVRMFLAQMSALNVSVERDRGSLDMLATICRRLDGIPLALELAAARAAVFGIRRLAAELDDRFQSLTGGRKTAPPRQQTLAASLDWSYKLLGAAERVVLQRLAVFPDRFSLDEVCTVAACEWLSRNEVMEAIVGLASKCLLMTSFDSTTRDYFLLETTRDYALRKSGESDDAGVVTSARTEPRMRTLGAAARGGRLVLVSAASR
ncbi:winged helix-turn-helix domain-containing protein [Caballeronia sp. GACF4]|uniref:ATP-binding protein n=1 Tax=Caballeronia sp. GACF4 TaxID=2921763 RepID=UPI002027C611|nr:winged helix-turn-helix domain-containing protein [Caballeronia sp. GACF4]